MLRFRTCAAVAAAALAWAGAASQAGAQANCEMYGKLTLQQQKDNMAGKCGFSGAEWSPDLKAHIAWCNSVSPDQWKAQLQKRKQQLDTCKPAQ
jgi:hypothetical protein